MRAGWAAALLAAVFIGFGATLYLTLRLSLFGREVVVPDVVDMSIEQAREALGAAELYVEATAERYDGTIAQGRIQSQDPPAGATIKKNRKVRVTMSLGPMEIEIPDLRGQTLRTAQLTLRGAGLPLGSVSLARVAGVPPDTVAAQDPLPTSSGAFDAPRGDGSVSLLVSEGVPEVTYVMPDLSRRGISEVRAMAERSGLRIGAVRRERVPGAPRGTVVRQYPPAGRPVGRQDIISLVLSE